jgi:hypothetical protein
MARFVVFSHVNPDEPPVAVNPEHVVAIQGYTSDNKNHLDGFHLLLTPGDTGVLVRHVGSLESIVRLLTEE